MEAKMEQSGRFYKQEVGRIRKVGKKPISSIGQAGNPLSVRQQIILKGETKMKRKEIEKAVDRHIRITDMETMRQIDEIMEHPEYKSFSKVISDALFYGLPILRNKLYGEVTLDDEQPATLRPQINGSRLDGELFDTIVKLMKETVLNVTINKSILSSIFHDLERVNDALDLGNDLNDLYEKGLMSDTPDYLYEYEMEGLKKLRQ